MMPKKHWNGWSPCYLARPGRWSFCPLRALFSPTLCRSRRSRQGGSAGAPSSAPPLRVNIKARCTAESPGSARPVGSLATKDRSLGLPLPLFSPSNVHDALRVNTAARWSNHNISARHLRNTRRKVLLYPGMKAFRQSGFVIGVWRARFDKNKCIDLGTFATSPHTKPRSQPFIRVRLLLIRERLGPDTRSSTTSRYPSPLRSCQIFPSCQPSRVRAGGAPVIGLAEGDRRKANPRGFHDLRPSRLIMTVR